MKLNEMNNELKLWKLFLIMFLGKRHHYYVIKKPYFNN